MICPYCGQEMRRGMLTAGSWGITWWPSEAPSWDRVIVTKSRLTQSEAEAYHCASCHKLILDTET